MQKNKSLIIVFVLAICSISAIADFNFYYDFPASGDINSSVWSQIENTFEQTTYEGVGAVQCLGNGSTDLEEFGGLVLFPAQYNLLNTDAFTIEYMLKTTDIYGYSQVHLTSNASHLDNTNLDPYDVLNKFLVMQLSGDPLGGGDYVLMSLSLVEANTLGNITNRLYTYIPGSSATIPSPYFSWWVYKIKKGFNENGTAWIAAYVNDTLLGNRTTVFNYSANENPEAVIPAWLCRNEESNAYNWYMDWVNITVTSGAEANTAPVVVVTAPPNDTISGAQQNITFTSTDAEESTTDCSLYIDSILSSNNPTVANNTPTLFTPTWTTGAHQYYIECDDGTDIGSSGYYTFTFNSTHSIIVFNPVNNSQSAVQEPVEYEVYDSDHGTTSCQLFIDSALNASNASVINDTVSYFNPIWTEGLHTWHILCNDTTTTVDSGLFNHENTCTEDWTCIGFDSCLTNDTQLCNDVTDLNSCGVPYDGDYTEQGEFACNYCSRDISLFNSTVCEAGSQTNCYLDSNFAACCDVTGLASDCYNDEVQTEDTVCAAQPCSVFDYSANDISPATLNAGAILLIEFGKIMGILVLVVLGFWAYGFIKGRFF